MSDDAKAVLMNFEMQRENEIDKFKNRSDNAQNPDNTASPSCSNESNNTCSCGCVGYAYIPEQIFNQTYAPDEGLSNGTIFPELNLSIDEYGKVCKGVGM